MFARTGYHSRNIPERSRMPVLILYALRTPNLSLLICWSAPYFICVMAAAFVLKTNCRHFSRFSFLISRKLHWCNKDVKCKNTLTLNTSLLGEFQKMTSFSTTGSSSLDLSGIFPPIVTPFEDNEEVSYGKLTENFSKWNDLSFRGKKASISIIEERKSFITSLINGTGQL